MTDNKHRYDHLLEMPHHQSKKRKAMSMTERAAQFGAFRALTGYEAAISETSRLTNEKVELVEDKKAEIDFKIKYISENLQLLPEISVKYFVQDKRKQGGKYVTKVGIIKKIQYYEKKLVFDDGTEIEVNEIFSIDGEIFNKNF